MKKSLSYLLSILICLNLLFSCIPVRAEGLNINAKCAIAMDARTRIVLFEKNSDMLVPIASTTKIMTSIVAMKYGNLDKKFIISAKAASISGSTVGYKKGEEITLKELLFGLMLRSGNDAAIAIAEGISGSVGEFSKLMNEEALEIGLPDSHFESPHGLDSVEHYATAYDLAMITSKAKEFKLFNEIVNSKDVDAKTYGFTRSYHNINKILWLLPGADGVKTGSTGDAGKCLVTSVKANGHDIIIVVLNCPGRWDETKKINAYVCKNYTYRKFYTKGQTIGEADIKKSKKKVQLQCNEDIEIPLKSGSNYAVKLIKPNDLKLPILKDDKVGSLFFYKDEKIIYESELIAKESIIKKKLFQK